MPEEYSAQQGDRRREGGWDGRDRRRRFDGWDGRDRRRDGGGGGRRWDDRMRQRIPFYFYPYFFGFPRNRCNWIDRYGRCCDRYGRCCDRYGRCDYYNRNPYRRYLPMGMNQEFGDMPQSPMIMAGMDDMEPLD